MRIRQRLPCVALFLAAATGIAIGRCIAMPAWAALALGGCLLIASFVERARLLLWPGIALTFAAVQIWQFRDAPSVHLAQSLSTSPQVCRAEIVVLEAPIPSRQGDHFRFKAKMLHLQLDGRDERPNCPVLVRWQGDEPAYGDRLRVRAAIQNVAPPRNPGEFDYAAYLANEGIRSELLVHGAGNVEWIGRKANPIVAFAIAARAWIERRLSVGIEGTTELGVILGMTVGDTTDTPEDVQDAFRETGTYHLFSVSGLHVGIVAVMLWFVFGLTGIDRQRLVLLVIPCLFFYALVTGLKPASLRAATMLSVLAAGVALDRSPVPLNSLGAAGLLILLFDTNELFNPGFQLSFAVVAAILLVAMPVYRRLSPIFDPDPFLPVRLIPPIERSARELGRWIVGLVSVSFAAWIGSLPLTLAYFHLISFASIPANLLAVPLAFVILALASTSLVTGSLSIWLGSVFNNTAWLLAHILLFIVGAFAELPFAYRYIAPPLPSSTIAQLTILDIGRGGAAIVETHSGTWLIDTGSTFAAAAITLPYLRSRGVNRLDGIILTHGDANHLGGFDRLFDTLHPRAVVDSGLKDRSFTRSSILRRLEEAGTPVIPARAGRVFQLADNVRMTVLFPPDNFSGAVSDDKSLVLRIDAGSFSALLLADAGLPTERWLLENQREALACDLLVMGRHVSGLTGSHRFLEAVHPQALVTTVAPFPAAERLSPQLEQSARKLGIRLYPQDRTGAVIVTCAQDSFTLRPFLDADTSIHSDTSPR